MLIHRRSLLQAAGVTLALPMLESMSPAFGARSEKPPKRMIMICSTLGIHGPSFFPKEWLAGKNRSGQNIAGQYGCHVGQQFGERQFSQRNKPAYIAGWGRFFSRGTCDL
jgi:hypothetical protein